MWKFLVSLLATLVLSCGDTPETECTLSSDCVDGEICQENVCTIDITQVNIELFSVDRDAINLRESITLEWQITIVDSAEIIGSDGLIYPIPPVDLDAGSLTITPEATTTYTLTAVKGDDRASEEVNIRVIRPAAEILEFGVSETKALRGESLRFHWKTTNVDNAQILFGESVVVNIDPEEFDDGFWNTSTANSGNYTLRVTGDDGESVTESVSVTITDLVPTIQSFAATRMKMVQGQTTSLQWRVSNADSIEIWNGATLVHSSTNLDGRFTVEPTQTTSYTLTAKSGEEVLTTDLLIEVFDPIEIVRFEASSTDFQAGESIELSWEVTGDVTQMYILGDQMTFDIEPADWFTGTLEITPSASTQFILVAANEVDSQSSLFNANLRGPDPVINSFEATPSLVPSGTFTTLSWSISGATSITINNGQQALNTTGRPIANGSMPVEVFGPTTFTLTASNTDGQVTSTVFVDTQNVVRILSFEANPPALVAGDTTTISWTTENATSITLTDADGNPYSLAGKNPQSDSVQIQVNQNTTFVLTAEGIGGPDTATAQALIFEPVQIVGFTATPTTVDAGETVLFTWTTSNASGIEIRCTSGAQLFNIDVSSADVVSDSVDAVFSATSTCEFLAFGFQGPDTASVNITVSP